ncbi:4-azaleucine resistance transporter AzlC [Fusobacterium naviforme]|nr:hypothetical protein F7P78_09735 [Fusobacterium naviforme]PSL09233.1 4-azaleucine resistance transporter AzlC [Fusobacterium naviforme]STO27778.1 azaleucine resistance protein AzlC [Fusobacterium naviforme]
MKQGAPLRALREAFPRTLPIFAGFWFLGLTYGVYMHVSGFSFWYPMLMSMTIFGADRFLLPSMCLILLLLALFRKPLSERGGLKA